MKPPQFDYRRPTSLAEALHLLQVPGSVVLAGGQSLLLELAYREIRPSALVDINSVPGLDSVTVEAGALRIGALVRHRRFERRVEVPADSGAGPLLELLSMAAPYVAHPPIRSRGTFCGSVAWGHPASEWNAVLTGLRATVHLSSMAGPRELSAPDWFMGDRHTARLPGELVTAVSLPCPEATCPEANSAAGFAEHRRTAASFAFVAVAVVLTAVDGGVTQARIGLAGAADTPLAALEYEQAVVGTAVGEAAAATRRVRPNTGEPYRDAVTAELVSRAVAQAEGRLR